MNYIIKNGILLLKDENGYRLKNEDVFIKDTIIESIGKTDNISHDNYEVVDAKDTLIIPGLINSHTHVYMNFMKNSADDLPFNSWLFDKILPIEAKMKKEDFYWCTLLGCLEMIKTGTTCFLDMHICENECAKAISTTGMRAFIGNCIRGNDLYKDGYDAFKNALEEKAKYESNLLKFVLSPHSIYTCSKKLLSQVANEAEKINMLKHIHLSESEKEITDCIKKHGKTPVELLSEIEFLDSKTIAAHCVKVNDKDIQLLKESNVNVVTNPSSNAKLGNGIAPITKMFSKDINVCLGTDSAASNNTLNMFREMNIFYLLHKAKNESATDISTTDVLNSVSINPAKAFGMSNKLGLIETGAYADLVFINLNSISLFPTNNILSSLCCSSNGSEVDSVMINGKFVMKNKQLVTIDEEKILFNAKHIADKYL